MNYFINWKRCSEEEYIKKDQELRLLFDNVLIWYVPSKDNICLMENLMLMEMKK